MTIRFIVSITICFLFSLQIYAQIRYSVDIDKKIDQMAIEIELPKEDYFNVHPSKALYSPHFELELRANNQSYEVRAIFDPILDKTDFRNNIEFDFQKTIAQISNNEMDHNIAIKGYTKSEKKRINADWAMKADFIPKDDFSEYKKVRLHYIYKESRGVIIYVINYTGNTQIPTKSIFKFKH